MKTLKYKYIKVIQQHYGQGWEDISEYETDSKGEPKEFTDTVINPKFPFRKQSLLAHDLKEYRLMGYSTRVIQRKEKIV